MGHSLTIDSGGRGRLLQSVSPRTADFLALVRTLFPEPVLSGVTVRTVSAAGGTHMTVVFIPDLMEPTDLDRVVLGPLSQGMPPGPPETLAQSGFFPAPDLVVAGDDAVLLEGLLAGMAAVHVDGHPSALLVGRRGIALRKTVFGGDLRENVTILHRCLPVPGLRIKTDAGSNGNRTAVAYLSGVAQPKTVADVTAWCTTLHLKPPVKPWWSPPVMGVFRLPPAMESPSPILVAEAMRRGYVAVLADGLPGALVAPTTLELLFTGTQDGSMPPWLRKLVMFTRLLATLTALTLCSGFVAITSYHHELLPGPFLVALASARQNLPFPLAIEILLFCDILGDVLWATSVRLGGERAILFAYIATILVAMLGLQAGAVATLSVMICVTCATAHLVLPSAPLSRIVRAWAYPLFLAATGLGIFGMALMFFGLVIYLEEEQPFGNPVRYPPEVISP